MKPGQVMHKVWVTTEHEGTDESVGVIIVEADPDCDPMQIAASAMLALSKARFTVRGTFPDYYNNPHFTTDELKEWLA